MRLATSDNLVQVAITLSRGLGRTERRILEYLDEKARRSKITELRTVESYADTSEIAAALRISSDVVCQAVDALLRRGCIRLYPNGRRRNRFLVQLFYLQSQQKKFRALSEQF